MKIYFKRIKVFIISFIVSLLLVGCKTNEIDYTGEYPELYSIAINSLLGSNGYALSERKFSPEIKLVEEDAYGRKLFIYFENKAVSTFSLFISQKSDDKYAYYYPDFNFISIPMGEVEDTDFLVTSVKDFPAEEIERLKKNNDWGFKVNLDKCEKAKIVRKKEEGPIDYHTIKPLYDKIFGEDAYVAKYSVHFLNLDKYGRSIYLANGKYSSNRYVVMLFEPDGTCDESKGLMELSDTQNYQDELKQFKELNNWNQPL